MTDHGQRGATERLRHGFFATLLGVTGVVLSVLGFLAVRNPAAARLVASSDGVASLLTGLAFTAIACALVLHYGRRSEQLSAAYRELHRATLQRERSEAAASRSPSARKRAFAYVSWPAASARKTPNGAASAIAAK